MVKKISKYVIFVTIFLNFIGCFGGSDDAKDDARFKKIILISNKTEMSADGVDTVIFTVKAYNQDNIEVSANIKIYNDGLEMTGNTFTTTITGNYKFKAKYESTESNEVSIMAKKLNEYIVDIKGYTYSYEAMLGITRTVSATNVKIDGNSVDIGMMKITEGKHLLEFKGFDKQPSKYDAGKIIDHKYTINILANSTLKIYPWKYELELK